MKDIEWNDGMGHRSRRPWLLLVADGRVVPFEGKSIPKVCAVLNTAFTKNGKWSNTTYLLRLADGVSHLSGMDGWEEGTFAEGLAGLSEVHDRLGGRPLAQSHPARPAIWSWDLMARALGVEIPAAQEFLRAWRPRAAEAIDEREAAVAAL